MAVEILRCAEFSPHPLVWFFAASCVVQGPANRKRIAFVALVGWILASQCHSKDTGLQHHGQVPIHAGEALLFSTNNNRPKKKPLKNLTLYLLEIILKGLKNIKKDIYLLINNISFVIKLISLRYYKFILYVTVFCYPFLLRLALSYSVWW